MNHLDLRRTELLNYTLAICGRLNYYRQALEFLIINESLKAECVSVCVHVTSCLRTVYIKLEGSQRTQTAARKKEKGKGNIEVWNPSKFQPIPCLGFVTAATSLNGGQPNFAQSLSAYVYTCGALAP